MQNAREVEHQIEIGIVAGQIAREIEIRASALGITRSELANRVAQVLQGQNPPVWEGSRHTNSMPVLRRKAPQKDSASRSTKMAPNPRGNGARNRTKSLSKGVSDWWHKNFPTPEARSAEVKRRRNMRKK